MRIRPAIPADTRRLGELAAALVRFHHELDPGRFFRADDVAEGYGTWLAREAKRGAIVLVAEGDLPGPTPGDPPGTTILGYAYATLEERDWNELLDAHGKLHDVFVDPAARRRGVARALLLAARDALVARGAPRIVLSTAHGNAEAQALFAALGFRPSMIEMTWTPPG